MKNWIKIGKAALVPPMALLLILLPTAAVLLVYSMTALGSDSLYSIASYVLAAYTLAVWCCRVPGIIRWVRKIRKENPFLRRWIGDIRFRILVSLWGSFLWNGMYGVFQLCLGFYHRSFWYGALAAYYGFLGLMRLFLAAYIKRHAPGENISAELKKYRLCGWIFLGLNLALTVMIFFMVYWNRTFHHHQITAIAMAAYTFFSLAMAIVSIVKYRKLGSPVCSASKAISLAAACVSILTLESTMLTAFGAQTMDRLTRRLFLTISGGGISVLIIAMALYMILRANKQLRR